MKFGYEIDGNKEEIKNEKEKIDLYHFHLSIRRCGPTTARHPPNV